LTLLAWSVGPNQGGKNTVISFLYSGGFRASNEIDAPFDSSWHSLDDVRPILLAEQEGYGNYLGGTNGAFGINIKFSDNVLTAMKVQDFNPSQVGGANVPPSSTTLTSDQTTWLQKIGYSVQPTNQSTSTPTPTTKPTPTSASPSQTQTQSQSQSQPKPKPSPQKATSTQTNTTTASTLTQQSKNNTSSTSAPSNSVVGQIAKTSSGPITSKMAAADQKMAAQNPPSLNPANIPIKVPVKKETSTTRNIWIWIAAGVVILVLVAVAGRVLYVRHRKA